jgi:hypothetical protein
VAPTDQSVAASCPVARAVTTVLQKAVAWVNQAMYIRGRWTLCEYINPLLLAREMRVIHIHHLQSTCYSGVGSGSPGTAHLSYVSPRWAQSKDGKGG